MDGTKKCTVPKVINKENHFAHAHAICSRCRNYAIRQGELSLATAKCAAQGAQTEAAVHAENAEEGDG